MNSRIKHVQGCHAYRQKTWVTWYNVRSTVLVLQGIIVSPQSKIFRVPANLKNIETVHPSRVIPKNSSRSLKNRVIHISR